MATLNLHERAEQLANDLMTGWNKYQLAAIESALRDVVEECAKVADTEYLWANANCDGDIRVGQVGASSRIAAAIRRLKEEG